MKDYGHKDQIGYGQPDDEYLLDMRRIFRALFAHTRRDGSLWLIADTPRRPSSIAGVWEVQPLPFRLADEAAREGWVLRDVVIWVKDKTLPWSSRGRMRNGFEYVLFFVKTDRFQYHVNRLREPANLEQWWVRYPERYNPQGKAPSNVWEVPIPVQGSWANTAVRHACPLPADLIERMLLLSTSEGDVVFDPFAGSGVVVAESQRLSRRGVGLELVDDYIEAFRTTVLPEITERRGVDVLQQVLARSERLRDTILDLRAVKYPKVVGQRARDIDPLLPRPIAIYALRRNKRRTPLAVDVVVVLRDCDAKHSEGFFEALRRASKRAPASKFGVSPRFRVLVRSDIGRLHRGRRLYAYVGGQTHRAAGLCTVSNVDEWADSPSRHNVPVVVSNVWVDESPRRLRLAEEAADG
jgi:hypothetical protein